MTHNLGAEGGGGGILEEVIHVKLGPQLRHWQGGES